MVKRWKNCVTHDKFKRKYWCRNSPNPCFKSSCTVFSFAALNAGKKIEGTDESNEDKNVNDTSICVNISNTESDKVSNLTYLFWK